MIVVIADDLTGATELGGIGLRYGLKVEVAFEVNKSSKADLLIICSDTRSYPEAEAIRLTKALCKEIKALNAGLVFKKVDSVLRGHIVPELEAQLQIFEKDTVLLLPANPALGRTIEKGIYFIHGRPIAETAFRDDPEFPIKSSELVQILAERTLQVKVQEAAPIESKGSIIIGEVAGEQDFITWINHLNDQVVIAGGSGFFRAILKNKGFEESREAVQLSPLRGSRLYVCGTAFESSAHRVASLKAESGPVHYIPDSLLEKEFDFQDLSAFAESIQKDLERSAAILAVHAGIRKHRDLSALELRERTALIVKSVFGRTRVDELIIEGGSTASAILRALQIKTVIPAIEYAPGVIRCKAFEKKDLFITLKPGSYNWPREVWMF